MKHPKYEYGEKAPLTDELSGAVLADVVEGDDGLGGGVVAADEAELGPRRLPGQRDGLLLALDGVDGDVLLPAAEHLHRVRQPRVLWARLALLLLLRVALHLEGQGVQ